MLVLFMCVDIVDACWPCCMLAYLIYGGLVVLYWTHCCVFAFLIHVGIYDVCWHLRSSPA